MVVVVTKYTENHQFSELIKIKTGIKPVVFLTTVARTVNSSRRPVNNLVIHQTEILLDNRFPITAIRRCILHTDMKGIHQIVSVISLQLSPVAKDCLWKM